MKKHYCIFILAFLLSLRMLGLFMLLPTFSIFSNEYYNANSINIGIAIGIYGFSQSVFILPFGFLSDKYGRKKLITIGFLLLAVGSLIGFFSTSIYHVIAARFLQGSGAISSVLLAFVSDLSDEHNRTKYMALVGVSIGASFIASIILGPIVSYNFGIQNIFLFSFISSLIGIYMIHKYISDVFKSKLIDIYIIKKNIKKILNKNLIILYLGIFVIHANLTSMFLFIPKLLIQNGDFIFHSIKFYVPVMIISLFFALPLLVFVEKISLNTNSLLLIMLFLLLSNFCILEFHSSYSGLFMSLLFFFCSFNMLEAKLPSLVSQLSYSKLKGTTLGLFSCFQFLGIFFGGIAAGFIDYHFDLYFVILFCISLVIIWILIEVLILRKLYTVKKKEENL